MQPFEPQTRDHPNIPKSFQWWFDPFIDWLISNPGRPIQDAAPVFHKTRHYLYCVTQSDVFKERYNERRAAIAEELQREVINRTSRVAIEGLKIIEDRFKSQDTSRIPIKTLSEVTNGALKALGYGVPNGPSVVVNNSNSSTTIETSATSAAVAAAAKTIRGEYQRVERAPQATPLASQIDMFPEQDVFEESPKTAPKEPSIEDVDRLLFGKPEVSR